MSTIVTGSSIKLDTSCEVGLSFANADAAIRALPSDKQMSARTMLNSSATLESKLNSLDEVAKDFSPASKYLLHVIKSDPSAKLAQAATEILAQHYS